MRVTLVFRVPVLKITIEVMHLLFISLLQIINVLIDFIGNSHPSPEDARLHIFRLGSFEVWYYIGALN